MNKLELGKKYIIYTKEGTIEATKIIIVSILAYGETSRVPYALDSLFYNEKKEYSKDNTENTNYYLIDKAYYHCFELNSDGTYDDTNEQFLIWDDIIDFNKTVKLETEYSFKVNMKVDYDSEFSKKEVSDSIISHVKTKFGNNKDIIDIQDWGTGQNPHDLISIYEEKLKYSDSLLDRLSQLKSLEPMINKLIETDFNAIITSIQSDISNINSDLNRISAQLR